MQIYISREARSDVIETAAFIAEDNPDAAFRFLLRFEDTVNALAENPLIGSQREFEIQELQNLRFWPVKKFRNYLIIYKTARGNLEIIRVLNSRRDFSLLLLFE
ncbi:MAG: type II toxin-antitoxin system RelE/ParE family toxin [Aridibacter famidurans]|nr:type II toxin-antitoxin system RelE/ParE family toxin [Aridibacter famidurans]